MKGLLKHQTQPKLGQLDRVLCVYSNVF